MRWSIDGGPVVLTLRSIILSNRWEKFWSFFIRQHSPEVHTKYQAYDLHEPALKLAMMKLQPTKNWRASDATSGGGLNRKC
jgi:hypothetical protein